MFSKAQTAVVAIFLFGECDVSRGLHHKLSIDNEKVLFNDTRMVLDHWDAFNTSSVQSQEKPAVQMTGM